MTDEMSVNIAQLVMGGCSLFIRSPNNCQTRKMYEPPSQSPPPKECIHPHGNPPRLGDSRRPGVDGRRQLLPHPKVDAGQQRSNPTESARTSRQGVSNQYW